jgi:glutamate/tyrosine decarboxylase-like PLP-dependent enzyme
MRDFDENIMKGVTHWQSRHFHAYFPANSSYPSQLGAMLNHAINAIGFSWIACPSMTELETIVLDWMRIAIDLPEQFDSNSDSGGGGCIQGSASEANLVGLIAAREKAKHVDKKKLVVYLSDQGHSSYLKACKIAGFEETQIRVLKTSKSGNYAFPWENLELRVKEDLDLGNIPCFIGATLGTTNSTAFDNLKEIGEIANKYNIWLHVDAAYAGTAFICPEFRHFLRGVELVDSFSMNPHKWMCVNFDCSLMWVKERKYLINALSITPEYLRSEVYHKGLVTDYRDWQIPLGRSFRSLKLWFVLRMYGLDNLREIIRNHIRLAKLFESLVTKDDRFELFCESSMGLVCFSVKNWSEEKHKQLVDSIQKDGRIFLISTKIEEKPVIRFAICHPGQTEDDIYFAWKVILEQYSII